MFSWPIARREFSSLRREKTIILALVIQLFIAGFSSFLLFGLVAMYDPGSATGGEITIGVTGDERAEIISTIDGDRSRRTVAYDSVARAQTAFERGEIDAVLIAQTRDGGGVHIEALVPAESIRSTVIVVQVRDALKTIEQERRTRLASRLTHTPIDPPRVPSASPTFGFMYTVLLPLLVLLPVFISGSIAIDSITEEIDIGTLELLQVTPLSMTDIIDGKLVAMIGLVPVQVSAWLGLLAANGTSIHRPLLIILYSIALAVIVVTAGAAIAVSLRHRQSAQLLFSIGLILLFMLASLLPESPPNVIAKLAVDSHTSITLGVVLGTCLVACFLYGVSRPFIARATVA